MVRQGVQSIVASTARPRIGVFGLGEAGSEIAAGLVAAGTSVSAYDPAPVTTPPGVWRHEHPSAVVEDIDCLLAVTAAHDADTALQQSLADMHAGLVFADLSTSAPAQKRSRATAAAKVGVHFIDVALMATVPGKGIRTPQLAAGPEAVAYSALLGPLGAPITVIGDEPGLAMTRKLLRSVVTKGLGALLLEATAAGHAAGLDSWLWDHLVKTVTDADEALMTRLMDGMHQHAVRREEEMHATADLLAELGVPATMTNATHELIAALVPEMAPRPPSAADDLTSG